VILFHHRTGVDGFTTSIAQRLVRAGAVVAVPELFTGQPESLPAEERKSLLRDDAVICLTHQLVATVTARSGLTGAAAVGFCMGGRLALLAAASDTGITRACCFYGGGIDVGWHDPLSPVQRLAAGGCGPVQLHRGNRDSVVTSATDAAAVAAADMAGTYLEACVYAGARHAFCNTADTERYHPWAARRAWANAVGFLELEDGGSS
jgi:dienelactone hydrolase